MLDPNRARVAGRELQAKKIVLATGSRPAVPPIPGLAESGFIIHVEVFALEQMPGSLVVLEGGPIGIELAQLFSRFGSKVTVIEMSDQVLPREDQEVSQVVAEILAQEGITLVLGDKVTGVQSAVA
jgi:pyruvate/2-oxoglutarate dehydrogenase complex dihydrolipoamide dehydrogenase (E3) component